MAEVLSLFAILHSEFNIRYSTFNIFMVKMVKVLDG